MLAKRISSDIIRGNVRRKMKLKSRIIAILMLLVVLVGSVLVGLPVNAEDDEYYVGVGVSPMNESIVLNPGDTYKGSFRVSNPGYAKERIAYHTEVGPFYVDENHNPVYDNIDGASDLADWITVTSGATGELNPNDVTTVEFEINVPENAPGGGQYATISTVVEVSSADGSEGLSIGESVGISHIILAEIMGESVTAGRVVDMGMSSFVLGGDITAYSTVENTGNTHAKAGYTIKVYPLFSNEIVYTNENTNNKEYILPDRTYHHETVWEDTPMIGIYNVEYTVDYLGSTSTVTGMVVVCPWWLLIVIIIWLLLLILCIVTLAKVRKKREVLMVD